MPLVQVVFSVGLKCQKVKKNFVLLLSKKKSWKMERFETVDAFCARLSEKLRLSEKAFFFALKYL